MSMPFFLHPGNFPGVLQHRPDVLMLLRGSLVTQYHLKRRLSVGPLRIRKRFSWVVCFNLLHFILNFYFIVMEDTSLPAWRMHIVYM